MDRDDLRKNLLPFTERAFGLLPPLEEPRILDLGCGSGVPTMRLAQISRGTVVAVDTDLAALRLLREKAEAEDVGRRIHPCLASVDALPFQEGSFDLLWCEGALFALGFGASLRAWRRFLKPTGYLVAHDEAGEVREKLLEAEGDGYTALGVVDVPAGTWWTEYFEPGAGIPELAEEVRWFREHPERARSAFFVLARR